MTLKDKDTIISRIAVIEKEIQHISESLILFSGQLQKMEERIAKLEAIKNQIFGAFIITNIITGLLIAIYK